VTASAPASPWTGPARWAMVALLGVLCLAFALRLNALSGEELGLDGFLSVGLALEPWPVFFNFQVRDPHPPLYYLFLRGWFAFAGATFETARWPSIASGLISIVLMARIAWALAGPPAGLIAALLTTLAPAHLFSSVIVRDFAPGLALSLLALWLFPISPRFRPPAPRPWAALALATGVALLIWYFHVLVLLLQAGVALRRPRTAFPVLSSLAAGVALSFSWLVFTSVPQRP
jgi:mannosyltransferase